MRPSTRRGVLGQVVVDGDDVHALAVEGVEVGRGGGQGLALTGLHLGDVAEVQCRAALDLDVVVPLADDPASRPRARWRRPRA